MLLGRLLEVAAARGMTRPWDKPMSDHDDNWLTVDDIAEQFGIAPAQILRWGRSGLLKPSRNGRGEFVFSRESIDRMLDPGSEGERGKKPDRSMG